MSDGERTQRKIKQARADRAETARLTIQGYGPDQIARKMNENGDESATADRVVSDLRNVELSDFAPCPEGMKTSVYEAAKASIHLQLARGAVVISGDKAIMEKIEDLTRQLELLTGSVE